MNYTIHVTQEAEDDLREIVNYISFVLENPPAARSTALAIRDEMASLAEMPHRGSLANNTILSALGIRFIMFKNYYIFYRINETTDDVDILRIQYAKRDWTNLLIPKFW